MPRNSKTYTIKHTPGKDPDTVKPAVFFDWLAAGYIEVIKRKFPRKARVADGFVPWFDTDGNLQIKREKHRLPVGPRIRIFTAIIMAQAIFNERYAKISDADLKRETELNYQPGGQKCAITIGGEMRGWSAERLREEARTRKETRIIDCSPL